MSEEFECAWESVRPVPRVMIDFGDGRSLERTLHGNVVTYFCTSDGRVFDLLPGIVDAREFSWRMGRAQTLYYGRPPARRDERLIPPLSVGQMGVSISQVSNGRASIERLQERATSFHEFLRDRDRQDAPRLDPALQDPAFTSKFRVEREIDDRLGPLLSSPDRASLDLDTQTARRALYPLASQVWLERPLTRPAEITNEVYLRVLGVDLDDPYLGLAPDVLGGELGRR